MKPVRLVASLSLAVAALSLAVSACREPPEPPPPAAVCNDDARETVTFEPGRLVVHFDASSAPHLAPVRADLERYLGEVWGTPIALREGAPAGDGPAVWLSAGAAARAKFGELANGFGFKRLEEAGGPVWLVYASSEENLAFAAYAFLEELGVRFFHPREELVPRLGAIRLPAHFAAAREPAFATRGIQLHLLHPLEYLDSFNKPGPESLAEAKQFIDWLVKTGQNYLQWWPMVTMDLKAWKPHARAIVEYAHLRKVKAGVVGHLWEGSNLQKAFALVTRTQGWQQELEANVDFLLDEVPFDVIEVGLGEFLAKDAASTIAWLDHATAYVHTKHPGVELSVVNHVGNYPNLYLQHDGKTVYFYHLPAYADRRLINNVHTVYLFDLYREGGMYAHENFHHQREYLFSQLPHRKVRYLPESAYWCSSDIDVPAFLPEYLNSRWIDIHNLHRDTRAKGLPPLEGHVMFSSGHEWGYWLTDYLAAKMMWEPEKQLSQFVRHYAGAFGACESRVTSLLTDFIALQTEYLFEKKLVAYLSGEDQHVDFGSHTGFITHPPRPPFIDVLRKNSEELRAFEQTDIAALETVDRRASELLKGVQEVCASAPAQAKSWCAELEDGVEIIALRMRHTALLYRAIVASARRSADAERFLTESDAVVEQAKQVVTRRAAHYRFPLERLTGAYENPTVYKFGYLRQAHTLCMWTRRRLEAAEVMRTRNPPDWLALPSCLE